MRAEDFPALLGGMELPGVEVKPANGKPGSGLNLGFLVTSPTGARMAWQVLLTTDGAEPVEGAPTVRHEMPPMPEAVERGRLTLAEIPAAICAWISRSPAAPFIAEIGRYTSVAKDGKTGQVRQELPGIRLALRNGEAVWLHLLWMLEPDEGPTPDNKGRPRPAV